MSDANPNTVDDYNCQVTAIGSQNLHLQDMPLQNRSVMEPPVKSPQFNQANVSLNLPMPVLSKEASPRILNGAITDGNASQEMYSKT